MSSTDGIVEAGLRASRITDGDPYEGPRTDDGLQELGTRQSHKRMSKADQALHERVLMVEIIARGENDIVRRAIQWRDNEERIALMRTRGFMIVQDPYIDPAIGGKTRILPVRTGPVVPHQTIAAPKANG